MQCPKCAMVSVHGMLNPTSCPGIGSAKLFSGVEQLLSGTPFSTSTGGAGYPDVQLIELLAPVGSDALSSIPPIVCIGTASSERMNSGRWAAGVCGQSKYHRQWRPRPSMLLNEITPPCGGSSAPSTNVVHPGKTVRIDESGRARIMDKGLWSRT